MSDIVRIDFACNDPDNGLFAHCVEQIQLPDQLLELSAKSMRPPRFAERPNAIRVCRRWWPTKRSTGWYGNWCWDAHWFDASVATELICAIHKSRLFCCDEGETRLYNLWQLDEPLDAEFLNRMLVKSMLAERAA